MQQKNSWLLPDGIEEVLPEEAKHLEYLRRKLLDMFACWGYELVIPPFIDFLDSLLTGSGHDLALQTFKVTDQVSGEMLGIRADMTPQVARIDAHNLQHDWPTRLCYAGTTLHTRGDPLEKSRSPMQIGAELYGHSGIESDIEIIRLMLEMLAMSGLLNVHLDLGHVGIYRALSAQAELDDVQESALFEILQRKAIPELQQFLANHAMESELKAMFLALPRLNGDHHIIDQACQAFGRTNEDLNQALDELRAIASTLSRQFPTLPLSFDLAELRGYHYHTGVLFSAFVPAVGREIARGGRYDNIGGVFGRARPATGFSADLKVLSALGKINGQVLTTDRIMAPAVDDMNLLNKIRDLRAEGLTVVQLLPGQSGGAEELGCTSILVLDQGQWLVRTLN